jgi:hypothetical protein
MNRKGLSKVAVEIVSTEDADGRQHAIDTQVDVYTRKPGQRRRAPVFLDSLIRDKKGKPRKAS